MNRRQAIAALLCSSVMPAAAAPARRFDEVFRPQVHFSPAKNWTNDPNGLVYHKGRYHLFFQHNPFGDKWGHMSWGHAVSTDLLHWHELSVAIPEDAGVMIFSGCVVVDAPNTSGFGTPENPPLVAVYTGHHPQTEMQSQHIAFSLDDGLSWTKYRGNPVLDLGTKDFRDPKVFWFEDHWAMAVAKSDERKVLFYRSQDLKSWSRTGEFGPAGAVDGVWECPDLFPLPVAGGETRWVLKVDSSPTKAGSGCGGQAFVGTFDGKAFATHMTGSQSLDLGEDFYASASWSNLPPHRHVTIGWMASPRYAGDTPTAPWRGAMSLPREVSLRATADGYRLLQQPVQELMALQTDHVHLRRLRLSPKGKVLFRAGPHDIARRIVVRAKPSAGLAIEFRSRSAPQIRIGLANKQLSVARAGPDTIPTFVSRNAAPLDTPDGVVRLDIIVDRSSVEAFANDGETTVCEQMFPDGGAYDVILSGDDAEFVALDLWTLKPIRT